MKLPGSLIGHLLSVCVGVTIGGVIAFAIGSALGGPEPIPVPSQPPDLLGVEPTAPTTQTPTKASPSRLLLAWASGGLPRSAENAVERLPGVRAATTVRAGVDWLEPPDPATPGAIPLEVAIVEPREYAAFVAPAMRRTIRSLDTTSAVVARGSPSGRESAARLQLTDRTLRVVGSSDEVATNGYEALLAGPTPRSWSRVDRFILVQLSDHEARRNVERRLQRLLRPGQSLRVRAKGETPFLRYGDAVLPQLVIKKTFGEFSAVQLENGDLEIDPSWVDTHIRTVDVPLLGKVTCHRALIPQLVDALDEVRAEGLGHTIAPGDYGGCFGPRFIGLEPGGRLSHHSWGIAIDINVSENAFGTKPNLDQRLVAIMERHGFTWGGRWLVPDGMHFEWVRFP